MNKYILIAFFFNFILSFKSDVEVSSDAAAAVKQQLDGQKQTFISSQSKAKTAKESPSDRSPEQEPGQRSISTSDSSQTLAWGYKDTQYTYGPNDWYKYYPICNGNLQSPIPLLTEIYKEVGQMMPPLKLEGTERDGVIMGDLVNDGHSFGMKINENKTDLGIKGGPLGNQSYSAYQFHFHFSCTDKQTGSEHSMDGLKYTAELHIVFYNTKYSTFDDAKDKPDGLTVLGFFIRSGSGINYGTFLLNRYLLDISNPGSLVKVAHGISIFDLVKALKDGIENLPYATYSGSLTTPPCFETVRWIVFQDPIKIPSSDLNSWRKLHGAHNSFLCGNDRPLQAVGPRKILYVNQGKHK